MKELFMNETQNQWLKIITSLNRYFNFICINWAFLLKVMCVCVCVCVCV